MCTYILLLLYIKNYTKTLEVMSNKFQVMKSRFIGNLYSPGLSSRKLSLTVPVMCSH
jgi:hypothetical protein